MLTSFQDSSTLLVAIDPSIRALGVTVCYPTGEPLSIRQLTQGSQGDYHPRSFNMASMLMAELLKWGVDLHVVMEVPTNWFNERGMDSKNSEAVQILYFTCGVIAGVLASQKRVRSVHLTTPAWKGQVGKPIMVARALEYAKMFGYELPPNISHDAAESLLLSKAAIRDFHGEMTVDAGVGSWVKLLECCQPVMMCEYADG